MSNEITTFTNAEFGSIRTITIANEPWFVGKDAADILGYSNTRKALIDHVDDEDKGVTKCDTLGGVQGYIPIAPHRTCYFRSSLMMTIRKNVSLVFSSEMPS